MHFQTYMCITAEYMHTHTLTHTHIYIYINILFVNS